MRHSREELRAIGQRMEQAWRASGIPREELERATGYTNPSLYRIFDGKMRPSQQALEKFAVAVGKPVSWFLGEDQDVAELVAGSLVAIFREVMDGAEPGDAFDKTTAEPLWLNPTARKALARQADALRAAITRHAGQDWESLSEEDRRRVLEEFARLALGK